MENPLAVWQRISAKMKKDKTTFATAKTQVAVEYAKEDAERTKFNDQFVVAADFRHAKWPHIEVGGQGLRGDP
ncbi:hypothetical protein NL533_33865, partial [Klebsiella pneumoniae]|nr:hypothetical protein [Klebsiella pneumoniae]